MAQPTISPAQLSEQALTVQQDLWLLGLRLRLPTDYWTRPVAAENREWWPILGNWPGTGYVGGGPMWDRSILTRTHKTNLHVTFTPWVQGPNSAHIVWKRQGAVAGLIGGPAGSRLHD